MSEKRSGIITLTTDFGLKDPYVGVVKGVILSYFPQAQIIDINHEIQPFDILSGIWSLRMSLPYFSSGSIHVAVVDPKVGTTQRRIALQLPDSIILAPDNGLVTPFISEAQKAFELSKNQFFRSNHSSTFHARDIFAPIAAQLAGGTQPETLADEIDIASLIRLESVESKVEEDRIEGSVVYIDHYGNLITNISADCRYKILELNVGGNIVRMAYGSYESITAGSPQAIVGSHGFLEIAANEGSAQQLLGIKNGTTIIAKVI